MLRRSPHACRFTSIRIPVFRFSPCSYCTPERLGIQWKVELPELVPDGGGGRPHEQAYGGGATLRYLSIMNSFSNNFPPKVRQGLTKPLQKNDNHPQSVEARHGVPLPVKKGLKRHARI
jgi:hypothetical protein